MLSPGNGATSPVGERLEDRCGGGNLFDGESFIETAIAQPVDFFNFNLHRNALFHRLNVADDADNLAAGVERVQRIQRGIQGFAVQSAEALIEKQRVYPESASASARLTRKLSPPDSVRVSRTASACQVSTTSSSRASLALRCSR